MTKKTEYDAGRLAEIKALQAAYENSGNDYPWLEGWLDAARMELGAK